VLFCTSIVVHVFIVCTGSSPHPFLGKKFAVYVSSQSVPLRFNGREFFARVEILASSESLQRAFDVFAERYLRGIIDRQIAKLRTKVITTNVTYRQGDKTFTKPERVSVNSYLKKIGFSQKIHYEIGSSQKEWGINKLAKGKKQFTLFFNRDLVKYDSGEHITYVVAHELAHVFHRDHGPDFQKALKQLYTKKTRSEDFFKRGIQSVFRKQHGGDISPGNTFVILVTLLIFYYTVSRSHLRFAVDTRLFQYE
jgi:predicted metal-dependent hydrolase